MPIFEIKFNNILGLKYVKQLECQALRKVVLLFSIMPHSRSPTPSNRDRLHRSTRKRSRDRSSERRHKSSRSSHKDRRRDRSRSSSRHRDSATDSARIYAPTDVALELGSGNVNMARLDKRAVEWLQSKINEQVSSKISDIEETVHERVKAAKVEMEKRLRQQIEAELKEEMETIHRREKDSQERCNAMERALEAKIMELEVAERKLNDERLEMLESKRRYEEERIELEKQRENTKKTEQQSILNKGGLMRDKIRLSFGK